MITSPTFSRLRGMAESLFRPSKKDLEAVQAERDAQNARREIGFLYERWMQAETTMRYMKTVAALLNDEQEKLKSCKPEQLSLLQAKISVLQSVLDIPMDAIKAAKQE